MNKGDFIGRNVLVEKLKDSTTPGKTKVGDSFTGKVIVSNVNQLIIKRTGVLNLLRSNISFDVESWYMDLNRFNTRHGIYSITIIK